MGKNICSKGWPWEGPWVSEHLHGIPMSLRRPPLGWQPSLMERGRPTEGEEVDGSGAIREMAAAFPPGRQPCVRMRMEGWENKGQDWQRTCSSWALSSHGGGGGGGATQVTAGCRVPSPKPRRLDTKYHQDESAECPFLGNSWLSPYLSQDVVTTGDLGT